MRRIRSSLLGPGGKANCYHVVSRVVGRELVFGDFEKEHFREVLERQLEFSGLECLAWCVMGNHFHLLLRVPDKETALEGWTEDDFIARLEVLSSETYTRRLLGDVEMWKGNGCEHMVTQVAARVRARLFDLSVFMKELKQKFAAWFNLTHGRKGTLWEERFRGVLVEGKGGSSSEGLGGLLAVAAYIDLNPVRAGIVDDPKDYRWCSYAAAVAGKKLARSGLAACVGKGKSAGWRKVGAAYRVVLFGAGGARRGGKTPDGWERGRRGFSQRQIESVWRAGGKLSIAEVLRCRVRYFTEGVALGSSGFLAEFARRMPGRSKVCQLEGVNLGGLMFFGQRKTDGIRAPS